MIRSEHWRARLLALKSGLLADLETGASAAATVELDQARVGRVSRMDAMQAQAMSLAANRRRHLQLRRVEAALARIADGCFGDCVGCEEPIPAARLEIDPTVLKCIRCAESDEA